MINILNPICKAFQHFGNSNASNGGIPVHPEEPKASAPPHIADEKESAELNEDTDAERTYSVEEDVKEDREEEQQYTSDSASEIEEEEEEQED